MDISHKNRGFTLVEVVISLVVLAISLLALAALLTAATRNNSFGSHMTEASTFAQDKLEELRSMLWANVLSGNDEKPGSTGINYSRAWNVSNMANPAPPPADLLKTVDIRVLWNDGVSHSSHSIRLFSVLRNPESN